MNVSLLQYRESETPKRTKSVRDTLYPKLPNSIQRIEKYRDLITKRIIKDTLSQMRVFTMSSKIKPKRLKLVEYVVLRELCPKGEEERLYRMGGFSDSE